MPETRVWDPLGGQGGGFTLGKEMFPKNINKQNKTVWIKGSQGIHIVKNACGKYKNSEYLCFHSSIYEHENNIFAFLY